MHIALPGACAPALVDQPFRMHIAFLARPPAPQPLSLRSWTNPSACASPSLAPAPLRSWTNPSACTSPSLALAPLPAPLDPPGSLLVLSQRSAPCLQPDPAKFSARMGKDTLCAWAEQTTMCKEDVDALRESKYDGDKVVSSNLIKLQGAGLTFDGATRLMDEVTALSHGPGAQQLPVAAIPAAPTPAPQQHLTVPPTTPPTPSPPFNFPISLSSLFAMPLCGSGPPGVFAHVWPKPERGERHRLED